MKRSWLIKTASSEIVSFFVGMHQGIALYIFCFFILHISSFCQAFSLLDSVIIIHQEICQEMNHHWLDSCFSLFCDPIDPLI